MSKRVLFTAALAAATLVGGFGGTGATPAMARSMVVQDPACVASCQATFDAEEQRCRAIDTAGNWRGAVYTPCVAYARYQFDNCVAACPA